MCDFLQLVGLIGLACKVKFVIMEKEMEWKTYENYTGNTEIVIEYYPQKAAPGASR